MIDELQELREANPHQPGELFDSVFVPRDELIVALRTDASRFPALAEVLYQSRLWFSALHAARLRWVAALAAFVVAAVALGQWVGLRDAVDVDVADIPTSIPVDRSPTPPPTSADVVAPTIAGSTGTSSPLAPSSSTTLASPAEITSEASPPTTAPTTDEPDTAVVAPGAVTSAPATTPGTALAGSTSTITPSESALDGPFAPGVDLLVVQLDFAHTDDGVAAVATMDVVEAFGIEPFVVAGTASPSSDGFTHSYAELMTDVWGTGWVDASANRQAAVDQAASQWLATLDAGGDVWVAEGGVSDFSAEVLRAVRSARPTLDTSSRVHIVQHAQRNEDETIASDLALVMARTDYVRIDDGNNTNGTAGLRGPSSTFEANALTSSNADGWGAGLDYHTGEIDFSDTVTVLHIVGVGIDEVTNIDDFATRFLSPG